MSEAQGSRQADDIGAFAYKAELLRSHLGVAVAGVFFAKTAVQLGAVKVGTFEGIEVAVLAEDHTGSGASLVFHRYDEERAKRTRHYVLEPLSGHVTLTGTLEAKLIRNGKVIEER